MRFGQKETRNSNNALCIFRNGISIIKKNNVKHTSLFIMDYYLNNSSSSKWTVKTKSLKLCEYFTFYIYILLPTCKSMQCFL